MLGDEYLETKMGMKTLHIVLSLEIGGLERMVVNLCNALDPRRYEPFICCIRGSDPLGNDFAHPHRLACLSNHGRINISSLRMIVRLIKSERIAIVHTHNTAGLLYGFIPALLCRLPLVHTIHGLDRDYRNWSLINGIEKIAMRTARRIVCVSSQLKEFAIGQFGIAENRVIVVRNGVPIDLPDDEIVRVGDHSEIRIGSVGRLSAEKNYAFLVEAFADIRSRHPDCRLTLVGDGPEFERLRTMRDALSLNQEIELAGQSSDIGEYLRRFDIFVLVSLTEGISLSILEAMARSKICLVSDVGGNGEIIEHGRNGFLFKSGDRSDFLKNVDYIIANINGNAMRDIRKSARKTVEREYSLESMVGRYEDVYDAVAGGT